MHLFVAQASSPGIWCRRLIHHEEVAGLRYQPLLIPGPGPAASEIQMLAAGAMARAAGAHTHVHVTVDTPACVRRPRGTCQLPHG